MLLFYLFFVSAFHLHSLTRLKLRLQQIFVFSTIEKPPCFCVMLRYFVLRAQRSHTNTWDLVTIYHVVLVLVLVLLNLNTIASNTIQHLPICCFQQCWVMLHPFKWAFICNEVLENSMSYSYDKVLLSKIQNLT